MHNNDSNHMGFISGAMAGAGLMFLLDPNGGGRRRAWVRDKAVRGFNVSRHAANVVGRDLRNRSAGVAAEARHLLHREVPSDDVLEARVRSVLGRCCSHPSAIEVRCMDGECTLSGPILSSEVQRVVKRVEHIRGVCCVINNLEVHESAEDVPSLQGGRERDERWELMQNNWAPAWRLIAGAAGTGLALWGARARDHRVTGTALGLLGLGLLARGITNRETTWLIGRGERHGQRRAA